MQSLCIYQTSPRRHILQLQLSAHIEFPQLLELTQKLCVVEDSGFTNAANIFAIACRYCIAIIAANFASYIYGYRACMAKMAFVLI